MHLFVRASMRQRTRRNQPLCAASPVRVGSASIFQGRVGGSHSRIAMTHLLLYVPPPPSPGAAPTIVARVVAGTAAVLLTHRGHDGHAVARQLARQALAAGNSGRQKTPLRQGHTHTRMHAMQAPAYADTHADSHMQTHSHTQNTCQLAHNTPTPTNPPVEAGEARAHHGGARKEARAGHGLQPRGALRALAINLHAAARTCLGMEADVHAQVHAWRMHVCSTRMRAAYTYCARV